ncbi:hypothetical protein GPL20_05125 [Bradyrhizobium cajani]|uniref:Uncharacterized protein n=1 Tax=Bradyrhizobium cajani TaxID=1928661 RepID=A0A844TAJ4_9BRAD|nr:hypothetical protein [Bradyrhizobium cajani]
MRAQRSNPECLRGKTLDCFAALAMTEMSDGRRIVAIPPTPSPAPVRTPPRSACRNCPRS